MNEKCGCKYVPYLVSGYIEHCSLHKEAENLLKNLRLLVEAYDVDCPSRFKGLMLNAENAIAKAEGKE